MVIFIPVFWLISELIPALSGSGALGCWMQCQLPRNSRCPSLPMKSACLLKKTRRRKKGTVTVQMDKVLILSFNSLFDVEAGLRSIVEVQWDWFSFGSAECEYHQFLTRCWFWVLTIDLMSRLVFVEVQWDWLSFGSAEREYHQFGISALVTLHIVPYFVRIFFHGKSMN